MKYCYINPYSGRVSESYTSILKHKEEFPDWITEENRKRIVIESKRELKNHLKEIRKLHIRKYGK